MYLIADDFIVVLNEPVGQLRLFDESGLRLRLLTLNVYLLEDLQLFLGTRNHFVDQIVIGDFILLL